MYWHHIRTVLQIFDCKFLLFIFVLSSFHIIHFGYRFSARAFVCISKWNITAIQRQRRSDFLFSCLSFSLHHRFNQRLIIISCFRRFCRMKYGTYGLHSLNVSDTLDASSMLHIFGSLQVFKHFAIHFRISIYAYYECIAAAFHISHNKKKNLWKNGKV